MEFITIKNTNKVWNYPESSNGVHASYLSIEDREENICKNCKHFREVLGSDVVFTERVEICDRLDIEWPFEIKCECFEYNENEDKKKPIGI